MEFSFTLVLIAATILISFRAFSSEKLINDLIFYPPAVTERKQWYRFITCGVIHADWGHLLFNMYALYLFGAGEGNTGVEFTFKALFGNLGSFYYLLMYVTALVVCMIPSYIKNKNNYHYRSLGASGAVSAVIFAYMFFNPTIKLGLLFIPIYIPGFLFGFIYLLISTWFANKGGGYINHSAHIWGAVWGILFVIIFCTAFSDYPVIEAFIQHISNMSASDFIQFGRY